MERFVVDGAERYGVLTCFDYVVLARNNEAAVLSGVALARAST